MHNQIKHKLLRKSPLLRGRRITPVPQIVLRKRPSAASSMLLAVTIALLATPANAGDKGPLSTNVFGIQEGYSDFVPTGLGGLPPSKRYSLQGHGISIATDLKIEGHTDIGGTLATSAERLKDVTYTLTWTSNGLTDEGVMALIKAAGTAAENMDDDLLKAIKSKGTNGVDWGKNNADMLEFVRTWSEADNHGDTIDRISFRYVDYGDHVPTEIRMDESNSTTVVTFAADQNSLQFSQETKFESIGYVKWDNEKEDNYPIEVPGISFDFGHSKPWAIEGAVAFDAENPTALNVDYADALKRRIDGGENLK